MHYLWLLRKHTLMSSRDVNVKTASWQVADCVDAAGAAVATNETDEIEFMTTTKSVK